MAGTMQHCRFFAWSLALILVAGPAFAQQTKELLSRESQEPLAAEPPNKPHYGGGPRPSNDNPYGLRRTNQNLDKADLKTFVTLQAGVKEGPIIESERARIIDELEKQFNVFIPNRDVLIVSDLTVEGLVNSLNKTLNESNTSGKDSTITFRGTTGREKQFSELKAFNKQALLNMLRYGNVPKGLRLPGMTNQAEQFDPNGLSTATGGYTKSNNATGNKTYFSAGGSQTSTGYKTTIGSGKKSGYATSFKEARDNYNTRNLVNKSGISDEFFEKLSNSLDEPGAVPRILRQLVEENSAYYSNGRPRQDEQGNPIYPNGKRKFDSQGNELYSNGKRKFSSSGTPLHSNGSRMTSGDGRALYPNGSPRVSLTGRPLFQDGTVETTEDGRELYPNGRPITTEDGVKLYPNGRRVFTGDGTGGAYKDGGGTVPKGDPQAKTLVKKLYPDGQPAYDEKGNRFFSGGARRTSDTGKYLYPNSREMANAGNAPLTPSGDRVKGSVGYQERPQGAINMYEVVEGKITQVEGNIITIKPGRDDEVQMPVFAVARETYNGDVIPGKHSELSKGLIVRAVTQSLWNFVNGRVVQKQSPRALAVLANNSRIGRNLNDGRYTVTYVLSGVSKGITADRNNLVVSVRSKDVSVMINLGTRLQKTVRGESVPADVRTVGARRKVDVVVQQSVTYNAGKKVDEGPLRALAVIQR